MTPLDRRRFLISTAWVGGAAALGLAGCRDRASEERPAEPAGRPLVPDPVDVLVTRWGVDPWTRGAWSSVAPTAIPDPRAELGRPLLDRVFFAGEATSLDAPGTLQGAYRSGQRAADAVAATLPASARLVVVGAGLAGLAAARRWDDRLGLAATVLEGRDRVGGRVATDRSWGDDLAVEYGAPWAFGDPNPVVDLARELGERPHLLPDGPLDTRGPGNPIDPAVARTAAQRAAQLRDLTAAQAAGLPPDASLAATLDRATIELGRRHPGLDPVTARLVQLDVVTGWLQPQAADAVDLSARAAPPATSPRSVVPGGLDQVTATLAQDMDVRLSRPAIAIEWSATGVVVQTNAGPIPADAVIVATPVGVLRSGQPTFDPPLPAATQAAIAAINPGRYEQCYLRFPRRFWGDASVIDLATGAPGSWSRWYDASDPIGAPVLLGVNAGAAAARLDGLSDRQVVAEAMAALRVAYR